MTDWNMQSTLHYTLLSVLRVEVDFALVIVTIPRMYQKKATNTDHIIYFLEVIN